MDEISHLSMHQNNKHTDEKNDLQQTIYKQELKHRSEKDELESMCRKLHK
jgi:hypothetical protein